MTDDGLNGEESKLTINLPRKDASNANKVLLYKLQPLEQIMDEPFHYNYTKQQIRLSEQNPIP
jgi:hypothetical protein